MHSSAIAPSLLKADMEKTMSLCKKNLRRNSKPFFNKFVH